MPRFFIETPTGDTLTIGGEDADHIGKSLRMRVGDPLTLCDGTTDFLCTIESIAKGAVSLRIGESHPNRTEPRDRITLYQCLPKGDKLETIVRQTTELGIDTILPVLSRRCVARPDAASFAKRRLRLERIAREAAGQSERGKIPTVGGLLSFDDALAQLTQHDLAVFCYEGEGRPLAELLDSRPSFPLSIGLLIGSEGGFDVCEVRQLLQAGIQPTTLGPRILRTETAPVAALSMILYATGNLDSQNTDR